MHSEVPGDEVAVAQAERLADAHAGLRQQADQEPVAQVLAGTEHHRHLFGGQRSGQATGGDQLHRTGRDQAGLADLVQERLVGAPVGLTPGH